MKNHVFNDFLRILCEIYCKLRSFTTQTLRFPFFSPEMKTLRYIHRKYRKQNRFLLSSDLGFFFNCYINIYFLWPNQHSVHLMYMQVKFDFIVFWFYIYGSISLREGT